MGDAAASTLDAVVAELVAGSPASAAARRLAEDIQPARIMADDRVVGLGWATVDTERTVAETACLAWEAPTREPALGARALVTGIGDVRLVLLEPDTEARLAAALARHGEGLCVAYVEGTGPGGMVRPTALGVPGRLRPHARPWGPFVIVVDPGGGSALGSGGSFGSTRSVG